MALNDFLSLPAAAIGKTPISGATAWTYGAWVEVSASLPTDIYVLGLAFSVTYPPAVADTNYEHLFELGTGAASAEVTKVQIPISIKADTIASSAAGYYKYGLNAFLPEPMTIAYGTRVAVRATDSIASAITYAGVKIFYREGAAPTTSIKSLDDLLYASVKSYNGLLMASVKNVNGLV